MTIDNQGMGAASLFSLSGIFLLACRGTPS